MMLSTAFTCPGRSSMHYQKVYQSLPEQPKVIVPNNQKVYHAKLGNITVGVIVLVLAAIVYIQQRFNCQKYSQMVKPEECEDLTSKYDLCKSLLSG
ncbi:hypothetical protein Acr_11g0006030 [Actinidia rufa]|uniref:Uncharacterized protein n=1 Tax=Actinidia rufa TaxID=165716 RepID=A0A7J0FEE7_9ERIC|nr:hypothetical protein Acr_11g0006030 [Actinidia rufa]